MKIKRLLTLSFCIFSLSGCVRAILPTSETDLISNALIASTEINNEMVSSYANLKRYMKKCVAYSSPNGYQVVETDLDRENGKAHFLGKSNFGTFTFEVILEDMAKDKTKIIYYSANKKIGFNERNPQKTVNRLGKFAMYDGKAKCKIPK